MTLYEEPRMRYICPGTWFLLLALANGVFQDLTSLSDLETVQSILGNLLCRARCRPEDLERPVIRGM